MMARAGPGELGATLHLPLLQPLPPQSLQLPPEPLSQVLQLLLELLPEPVVLQSGV
ncbi:MAG TPA: hypothetical protein VGC42_24235 [Kofleriaceae bacterium]